MLFTKDLRRQVNEFVDYKSEIRGVMVGSNHKEWLVKFIAVVPKNNVHDLDINDLYIFKGWLLDRYTGDFLINSALHSVRCFLRFYRRHDILNEMAKVGRKPNLEKIQQVQDLKRKGLSLRDIKTLMERGGRKVHLTTLHFWANYSR